MDILKKSKKELEMDIELPDTDAPAEKEAETRSRVDKSQYGNAPLGVETFVDYLRKDD